MAQQSAPQAPVAIGEVQSVTGRVVAIGIDGSERTLVPGDLVYAGDLIKTIGTSTVVVAMNDGSRFDLGRDAEALLDETVYSNDIPALAAAAVADIAEIQAAIAAGADPTEITDAPAAGGEQSDELGESLQAAVGVERTSRIGLVEAGFDTSSQQQTADPLLIDADNSLLIAGVDGDAGAGAGTGAIAPVVSITLFTIAGDNVINATEAAAATMAISGSVGGDVVDGDIVTLTVNGRDYSGPVSGGGFSIEVDSADLTGDTEVVANITVTNADGLSATASDTVSYLVDTTAPTIIVDAPDNTNNITPTIVGTTDAPVGSTVTLTVTDSTGAEQTLTTIVQAGGVYSVAVSTPLATGNYVVEARVSDAAGNEATATDPGSIDTSASAAITVDNITADDIVNAAEAAGTVAVSGTVGGDAAPGDAVTMTINGTVYNTTVNADGTTWSVDVAGSDLAADTEFDATVSGSDDAGNPFSATTTSTHTVDTTASATITVDNITADDIVNASEAAGTVTVTGTVGGDAAAGDAVTMTINGTVYNTTVNADGTTWSVDVAGSDLAADTEFDATVSGSDDAGNPFSATTTSTHTVDSAPVIMPLVDNVSEEGLLGGIADNNPAGTDTTNSTSVSGTMSISDPDGDAISAVTLTAPSDGAFTSGGENVLWSGSGTGTLTATAGGQTVATLSIDTSGNYTFDLLAPFDHVGDAGQEGLLELGFGVSVTAGTQTTSVPAALRINVEDDAPPAIPAVTESVATLDSNVLIMLDVSGSMGTSDGVGGDTRLESAIDSINRLLDSYEDLGAVQVRLVTFSSSASAQGSEWMTVDEVRTALASLTADGGTDYDAALSAAQTAFTDVGAISGAQNVAYFFSDGEPNSGDEVNPSDEAQWRDFLTTNEINSFAIGIGSGIGTDAINPIAYDGQGARDSDAELVTDFAQLDDLLAGTVLTNFSGFLHASGDIGIGTLFGADGGNVHSIVSEGTTYTYDPDTDSITATGGPDRSTFDAATDTLVITNSTGGVLSINLGQGTYSYNAPGGVASADAGTTIGYTIIDGDGDTATSSLTIEVDRTNIQIDSGTFQGTDGADLLIGRPTVQTNQVTGSVAAGSTFSTGTDQFAFSFDSGLAGIHVTQISINLRGGSDTNAIFDTSGSSSFGPALGTLTGISAGDITFSPADGEPDSPVLTLDFAAGSFEIGDEVRFGVDTDFLSGDRGSDFASRGVTFTVTLSDGSTTTVTYGSDGAGGSAATATIDVSTDGVTVDGQGGDDILVGTDAADVLDGGAGRDQLHGEGGDDILVGGAGDDILTGGSGADIFDWNAGDAGSLGIPATDVVTDFSLVEGDALDLRDLLQNEEISGDLTAYLNFEQDGADTVVHISSNGGFAGGYDAAAEDQTIVLENVDLNALGANDQQIIDALLAGSNLITD